MHFRKDLPLILQGAGSFYDCEATDIELFYNRRDLFFTNNYFCNLLEIKIQ